MDKQKETAFYNLLERLEKVEKDKMTPLQKIQEGYAEQRKIEEKEKEEAFKKYTESGTDIDQLTPLEKGAILERERQAKMEQEREKLGKAMAELKETKERQKNWINKRPTDPIDLKH